VCLGIVSLAGLRDMVPVEIVNVCGFLARQALGVWPSTAEIVQACVGLRGVGSAKQRL
jgi:hypothetical protein